MSRRTLALAFAIFASCLTASAQISVVSQTRAVDLSARAVSSSGQIVTNTWTLVAPDLAPFITDHSIDAASSPSLGFARATQTSTLAADWITGVGTTHYLRDVPSRCLIALRSPRFRSRYACRRRRRQVFHGLWRQKGERDATAHLNRMNWATDGARRGVDSLFLSTAKSM